MRIGWQLPSNDLRLTARYSEHCEVSLLFRMDVSGWTNLKYPEFAVATGLTSALGVPSVVMMGFRSPPFLLFLPPVLFPLPLMFPGPSGLPLTDATTVGAGVTTGFTLLTAGFLISPPFIFKRSMI